MRFRYAIIAFAVITAACAGGPARTRAQTPAASAADSAAALVAPGLGTLKQDEFTMALRSEALLVKVTPLDESVIRLAAPDTYNRLRALRLSREKEAAARTNVDTPQLFLISFFSYQPEVPFQPEDVQLEHQGRVMRPAGILPLTPAWGKQRLGQQEIATAVYAFADAVNYEQAIVLRYGANENADWQRIISKLQIERGKVTGRAKN